MIKKTSKSQPLDESPAIAQVIITDYEDLDEEYVCTGRYYGDGRVAVKYKKHWLAVNPECYHPEDPKRLYVVKTGDWSRFRIRSVILDSKAIRRTQSKTGKCTSLQTV